MTSTIEEIIKDRELNNEKIVGYARFLFFTFICSFDFLSYYEILNYTLLKPTLLTLGMDLSIIIFSLIVLVILKKNQYYPNLKYFTITMDYLFSSMMLMFDPSVPRDGETIYWASMVAAFFLFFLNLLRYSVPGTIYATFLSLFLFIGTSYTINPKDIDHLIPMILPFLILHYIGYLISNSSRKMLEEANTKKIMERYLSPQLINQLYKNQNQITSDVSNREINILFSDIRSFTTISEKYPPEKVVKLLNKYLTSMTEIIFSYNGTIDKFIGDAIMVLFGAPIKKEDDSFRALNTALDMVDKMKTFNKETNILEELLEIGIGIHTGEAIVGNIGSDKRLDYTAIGDNVNLASRLESLTKYYSVSILISESTVNSLKEKDQLKFFIIREIDHVIVKGRSNSIRIFELLGKNS
jgi:adenylate cyclase